MDSPEWIDSIGCVVAVLEPLDIRCHQRNHSVPIVFRRRSIVSELVPVRTIPSEFENILKSFNCFSFIFTQLQRHQNNRSRLQIFPKRIVVQMRSVAYRKASAGIHLANILPSCSRTHRTWRYLAQPSIESPSAYRQRSSSVAIGMETSMRRSYASSRSMIRRRE